MKKKTYIKGQKPLAVLALSFGAFVGTSLYAGLEDFSLNERLESFNRLLEGVKSISGEVWSLSSQEERDLFFRNYCKMLDAVQWELYEQLTPEGKGLNFSRLSERNKTRAYPLLSEEWRTRNFSGLLETDQLAIWKSLPKEEKDRKSTGLFNLRIINKIKGLRQAWSELSPEQQRKIERGMFMHEIKEVLGIH